MKARLTGPALVLAVAAVLILSGASALGSLAPGHRAAGRGFTVRGHVGGLYPGVRKPLRLVVHNRGARVIHVRSLTTRVHSARRGCKATNIRVRRYRGRLRIAPHAWRRLSIQIRMLRSAPDACKKAVFRLEFRGRATR